MVFPMSVLGNAYVVAGQQSAALRMEAVQMVEKLRALTDQFSPALMQAAAICSGLGDKDRAFELMEKLWLYGMTDCFGLRSIRDSIISARMSATRDLCVVLIVPSMFYFLQNEDHLQGA